MAVIGRSDLDLWPAEVADAQRADDLAVMASGRPRTRVEQLPTRAARCGSRPSRRRRAAATGRSSAPWASPAT
jgi:hypothetical protein